MLQLYYICITLKQRYVEISILCSLVPPTVSEGNSTVVNTVGQMSEYWLIDNVYQKTTF